MVYFRFLLLLLLIKLSSHSFSQEWEWTKSASGPSIDKVTGVAIDMTGNIFVTGYFDSLIVFDSIVLVSAGGTDIFLAKYDGDGVLLWAKQIGGNSDDFATAVSTDNTGNCYITGYFFIQGTVSTFGNTTITDVGNADIFVSKFNAAGKLLWVRNSGGRGEDAGLGISTDLSGNCYVTGYFTGNAAFGNIKINSTGYTDVFISKYDAAGNLVWVRQAGGNYQDESTSISTDLAGNCYITGYFTGSIYFGNRMLTSAGYFDTDVFVAKYNPSGVLVWAKHAGGTGNDAGHSIHAMSNGNVLVAGIFKGTKSFGDNILTRVTGSNGFVAKFDMNGKMSWSQHTKGTDISEFRKVSADNEGNCYVTGIISGTVLFGNISYSSAGGEDVCLAKYDSKGNLMWVLQGGGANNDEGTTVAANGAGNCFLAGQFTESASFGRVQVTGNHMYDIFISRIK